MLLLSIVINHIVSYFIQQSDFELTSDIFNSGITLAHSAVCFGIDYLISHKKNGLGQTASDWEKARRQTTSIDADCPKLFGLAEDEIVYRHMIAVLEKRYADLTEPFCICRLSLGATLALDYTIRHKDKVSALVLIAEQK